MSRYISEKWLEDNAKMYSLGYYDSDEYAVPLELFDSAPSIEIVFCKDCRWARPRTLKGETGYSCLFHRTLKAEDGYCDVGERKESE
jgi:hypothetical protein